MLDIFDEIDKAGDSGDAYAQSDDIFDEVVQLESQELPARMELAKRKSPEQAAKHYSLSDDTGLPVEVIERNEAEVTAKDFDYDAMRKRAPLLAEMLRDQRNADLAQQELDNLTWFEEAARETKNFLSMPLAGAFQVSSSGYAFLASGQSALEALVQIPVAATAKTQELLGYGDAAKKSWDYMYRLNSASSALLEISRQEAESRAYWMPKASETRMSPAVLGGIESAFINIPAIAVSALTRNPNIGLGLMGGVSYGSTYLKGKDAGLGDFDAAVYGMNTAIAEVVPERFSLGMLLSDIDKHTGFTKILAKQMVAENITEQITTVWQDAVKWATLNPEKTLEEFMAERPDAAYQTMISTIVATGLQTSAIAGLGKLAGNQEEDVIAKIVEKANESNYRNLDKANFESYLQEAAEEYGSIDNVYIDSESAIQAMQEMERDDDAYRILEAQIDEASELNGDVVIPVGQFASSIATSENYKFLKDFVRLSPDPDAVTINAFERIQEANKNIVQKEETDRISKEVFEQLKATKKLTTSQARLSAQVIPAFVGANPQRMGLTAEEAYDMMGLKIIGPQDDIQAQPDRLTGLVESLKAGEDTAETQQLSALMESQGIDPAQDANEIINRLSTIKEFKQKPKVEEVVKSDPLSESSDWRQKTVTATLDDGSKQDINAGEAYDIIVKRKEKAQSILECLNANP